MGVVKQLSPVCLNASIKGLCKKQRHRVIPNQVTMDNRTVTGLACRLLPYWPKISTYSLWAVWKAAICLYVVQQSWACTA